MVKVIKKLLKLNINKYNKLYVLYLYDLRYSKIIDHF